MELKDYHPYRLPIIAGFFGMVLLIYLGILFNTQVTNHQTYLTQSLHSIAREETVVASRGIVTDRNGRTLVSNSSAYDLTFDASLLKDGEDQNTAILRLVELCDSQGRSWVDYLPISETTPFSYTLETMSDTQRRRLLTYLKSLKPAAELLGAYLLEHPELAKTEATESEEDTSSEITLTPAQQGKALLEQMPLSSFTEELLNNAGLTAPHLMDLMAEKMKLPDGFSGLERRRVLGVRYELALRKLNDYTNYVLSEDIDTTFISLIMDGNFAGAKITRSSIRQYETTYAAHILGTVSRIYAEDLKALKDKGYDGDDWIGRSGVEAAFEEYLKGTDGRRIISVNSDGKITGEYYETEPKPGNTVELTIDLDLQEAVETALAKTVTSMNAADGIDSRGAAAAVLKVHSGEVLSLASYPTYDLSTFRESEVYAALEADPAMPMYNRATQGTYAPGSTIKPLTAVAAVEEGKIGVHEKLFSPRTWRYPGYAASYANCWFGGSHGLIDASEAITVSCNYYFAEMGYRLGMDTLNEYLTAFGLGKPTGIEIGEKVGIQPENQEGENQAPWAAFGQANQLYTPLQLANYTAALVSGGNHYEAHLLKAVKSYDNSKVIAVNSTEPINVIDITNSTLTAVKEGMHNLTKGSLAPYFKNCIVSAGAKTGTAQVSRNTKNNGVFICFAPYEEPEIALAIVIEKGGSGSALASVAVEILNAYFSADEIGMTTLSENQLMM